MLFEVTSGREEWRALTLDAEHRVMSQLLQSLKEDDVFYDVGACIGTYALHAARRCRQVIAFEPDPAFCGRLQRNIELNKCSNINVIAVALSDRNGMEVLFTDGVDGSSPSLVCSGQSGKTSVQVLRLDDILESAHLPLPDVLKMDIEGAEILAVRGAQALLSSRQKPRRLFIELHPAMLESFGSNVDEVIGLLLSNGYHPSFSSTRRTQCHVVFDA